MQYYTKTEVAKELDLTQSGFWRISQECEFKPSIEKKNICLYSENDLEHIKKVYALKRKGIDPKVAKELVCKGLNREVWIIKEYKTAKVIESEKDLINNLKCFGSHQVIYVNLQDFIMA